jgi:hypothetical protein
VKRFQQEQQAAFRRRAITLARTQALAVDCGNAERFFGDSGK